MSFRTLLRVARSPRSRAFAAWYVAFAAFTSSPIGAVAADRSPRIVEFGATFHSALGAIVIGSDGAIWAAESDGVARLGRDGSITQIRRPDDCRYGVDRYVFDPPCSDQQPAIGTGPDGAIWTNGTDRLLRFTEAGVKSIARTDTNSSGGTIAAFAASEDGIYRALTRETGLRVIGRDGLERRILQNVGFVDAIVARPDGALWLIADRGPGAARRLLLENRPALVSAAPATAPRVASRFVVQHTFAGHFAATPDGGLIADVAPVGPGPSDAVNEPSIVHIGPDGAVRAIASTASDHCCAVLPDAGGLAAARDGSVWFSEPNANRIVRIGPDGVRRDYRAGIPDGTTPVGITVDDDGSIWFSDPGRGTIGHIEPHTGSVRVFGSGLSPLCTPSGPLVTSDGAVWFDESYSFHGRIARIARDGQVREYREPGDAALLRQPLGTSVAFLLRTQSTANDALRPQTALHDEWRITMLDENGRLRAADRLYDDDGCRELVESCFFRKHKDRWLRAPSVLGGSFAIGPDGNLWFADVYRSEIGRLTRSGHVTYFTAGLTRWNSGPQYLTAGPDGAVWFTEVRSRVGRITMDGRITEFSAGIPRRSSLGGIVMGPDKNVWFTLYHGNELARITPLGVVTRFRRGIYPSRGNDFNVPDSMPFVDRAGNIWFNEPQGGRIARATILR